MEIGIFAIGDVTADPVSGRMPTEHERLKAIARIAVHAEEAGFDVFAIGEHHNPPFVSSSDVAILAYIAARTERIVLSTATTLITTNDPVRIAEEFATLQLLSDGRVDLMLGRGNTAEVYPWFGQDVRNGIALAVENYDLLRRLWTEEVVDWEGRFRTPLRGFTATPRPLDGVPPFVWHGSVRSPEIAEQAALHGDGFLVNNLFMTTDYFQRYVEFYRERYAAHGHGTPEQAIVGAAGAAFVRPNAQDARREYAPYFAASPFGRASASFEEAIANTGLIVGSPAQAVERILAFREFFGDHRRQLLAIDLAGVPEQVVHEQLDLLGSEVLPALKRAIAGHGSRVQAG